MAFDLPIYPQETALLVVDMQNGFCSPKGSRAQAGLDISMPRGIIPNVAALVDACRGAGMQIFWSRQIHYPGDRARAGRRIPSHLDRHAKPLQLCLRGTPDVDIVDELQPYVRPEDDVFVKHRMSCFFDTPFDTELRMRGIQILIVTGTTTSFCVDSTIRDAYMRDYDIVVPQDACADTQLDAHEAVIKGVRRFFGVVTTTQELVEAIEASRVAPAGRA